MEQLPQTMADILQRSIQLEEKGYQYYMESSVKVKNSLCKRTLERLASDEKQHIRRFTEIYNALSEQRLDQVKIEVISPTTFDEIFKRLAQQLKGAVDEMTEVGVDDTEALEMALDLENHTRFFYQDAAKKADNPKLKEFYQLLAAEEQAHYDVLRKSIDFMQDPSLFFAMGDSRRR
jgi:rubrerythrin